MTRQTIYDFYELEYKTSQLKLRNPEHPNLMKMEGRLNEICDSLLNDMCEIIANNISNNVDFLDIYDNEDDDDWSPYYDGDENAYRKQQLNSKKILNTATYALKDGSLGDKISAVSLCFNWGHQGGTMFGELDIDDSILDEMTEGKYIPKWDKELKKIAIKKRSIDNMQVQSKEYDLVNHLIGQFKELGVTEVSWKDFQKKWPGFSQRYSSLIQTIRNNKPKITLDDLESWLWNHEHESKYNAGFTTYRDPEHSFRDAEQVVLQINRGAKINDIFANDREMKQFFTMLSNGGQGSGHPVAWNTVGWFRLDKITEEYILIDEIQSDMLQAIELMNGLISSEDVGSFFYAYPESIQQQLLDRFHTSPEGMVNMCNGYQRQLIQDWGKGDPQKALETIAKLKEKIKSTFSDWIEEGLSTVIDYAREKGIKYVLLNTPENISSRDDAVSGDKLSMYYTQSARQFGFVKQQVDIEGLSGQFFVRQAKKFNSYSIIKSLKSLT